MSPNAFKTLDTGYLHQEIDLNLSLKRDKSSETVKPIKYYLLHKEPYLKNLEEYENRNKSPILKKIR